MKRAIWLSLVCCVMLSASTAAQISRREQAALLNLLQQAKSEKCAIEKRLSTVTNETSALSETLRQLKSEHAQQRHLWSEQKAYLQRQLVALEAERLQLKKDLRRADASIEYWESLSSEFEGYRSAAEKEIRRQKRQKLLLAGGEGLVILLLLIALL